MGTSFILYAGIVLSANMPVLQTGEVGAAPTIRFATVKLYKVIICFKEIFLKMNNFKKIFLYILTIFYKNIIINYKNMLILYRL